jgi:hypothetical protein
MENTINIFKPAVVLAISIFLVGCASSAKMENMVYQGNSNIYPEELKESIEVSSVTGGEKTNAAWTSEIDNDAFSSALRDSLAAQDLLSDNGRYQLEVKMLEVDQPLFGFDMTVTTHVKYTITDTVNNVVIFDQAIDAPYTATMGDAFAGVKRLRLANEGSGKKNIESLLEELSKLDIGEQNISFTQ